MAGAHYEPSFETFCELSKKGNMVPVCRILLADALTPVSAYDKFGRGNFSFLLESASGAGKLARYSFLGSDPFMLFKARGNTVEITRGDQTESFTSEDPIATLQEQITRYRAVTFSGLPPICGGAVGYAAYDAIRYVENLPNEPADPLGLPDLFFPFYDLMVVFDHLNKTLLVICTAQIKDDGPKAAYERAIERIDEAVERLRTPVDTLSDDITPHGEIVLPYESNFEKTDFCSAVERCKEYIYAGDIFQVVLSQRLTASTTADPFNIYRALRVINPSPYMFYLKLDDLRLIGSSPEVMVKSQDGKVTVRPIAGTRRRSDSEAEDNRLAKELLNDPKERAEHIMLLDLGRNDVGRICRYGSVQIEEQMIIERFSHVMHMTSTVTGMLDENKTCFDAFRGCFPAGTVSGAPKIRAMEIIDELEPLRRGPYAGAVGYFDFRGNMDTCIAIRTIVLKGTKAIVQSGAGIVADSVPETEHEETLNKARGLFRAIQVAEECFD